jgi:hypothetical protein
MAFPPQGSGRRYSSADCLSVVAFASRANTRYVSPAHESALARLVQ